MDDLEANYVRIDLGSIEPRFHAFTAFRAFAAAEKNNSDPRGNGLFSESIPSPKAEEEDAARWPETPLPEHLAKERLIRKNNLSS